MESYEASRKVFTRVQNIDHENASKIMGYILLHHGENDMLHLSYAPQSFLLSLVNRAKIHLGLSSNTSCALLVSPISDPVSISRPNPLDISLSSPGLSTGFDPSSPSSPSIWSPHYTAAANNNSNNNNINNNSFLDDLNLKDQNLGPFLNDPLNLPGKNVDFSEQSLEFSSFLDDNSSNISHRRSSSFNDNLSYYGGGCNFPHGGSHGGGGFSDDNCGGGHIVGSPCNYDAVVRAKLAHQHRLAAQFNFLHSEAQRSAAALMMSEEINKLNRVRMARHELLGLDCNPASRQIYLTFPADSTFKEEDVSNYFNKFGPVQDVRIPYQQKRMFGFVTFVFPETVKIILAKGNPHFVCDSRVLVKPYKEKGKLPDKKQHPHQFERGEFSCSSPSEHDGREPYDFPLSGRMLYNTQEMLLRKKLEEQAEFQHALELQERRLMNLQLLDVKNQPHQHNVSVGFHVQSPNQSTLSPYDDVNQDVAEENKGSPTVADVGFVSEGVEKESSSPNREGDQRFESLDHVLPDNLFASPTKTPSDIQPAELNNAAPSTSDNDSAMPATSSLKTCSTEMTRISTEHDEALGM
ncbi:hypothetical protein RND81_09G255900 [Saponaria officinalis]|uniref:RRM domain-containing protein n=1 Tax=Saponaria officinalis TaxID=3572 RepID=A0AAW1IRD4_SAPOF